MKYRVLDRHAPGAQWPKACVVSLELRMYLGSGALQGRRSVMRCHPQADWAALIHAAWS